MDNQSYAVPMTARFMTLSLLLAFLSAFGIGRLSRLLLLSDLHLPHEGARVVQREKSFFPTDYESQRRDGLPPPLAKEGKIIPQTVYTSKNFDTRKSGVSSSQWLQKDKLSWVDANDDDNNNDYDGPVPLNNKLVLLNGDSVEVVQHDMEDYDEDEKEHLPAGQHLLLDIEGVDSSFLNSEFELATAMIDLVNNSGLTLLSYHCHGLEPEGVSCAGVLLESHVSFHTWPKEGVITLDLFTCGSTSLLNHVDLMVGLFAIPNRNDPSSAPPKVLWAYKRRGFKNPISDTGKRDTFAYPLGIHGLEEKKEVASTTTDLGRKAWVYDMGSIASTHPMVDRLLYVDGVMKNTAMGEVVAYESLVHPSMLAHQHPESVLIVGPGIGATIREVLKHETVKEVVVIGADSAIRELATSSLAGWNDCSDLGGSTADSCFDDPRVKVFYDDPLTWMLSGESGTNNIDSSTTMFDVAIVDLFDVDEEQAKHIVENQACFLEKVHQHLTEDGVAVINVPGVTRPVDSPASVKNGDVGKVRVAQQDAVINDLLDRGFIETKQYDETQTGHFGARHYVVGFKSKPTVVNWGKNEAQVNLAILNRMAASKSGSSPLKHFDGATMFAYSGGLVSGQYHRECFDDPQPKSCMAKSRVELYETRGQLASFQLLEGRDQQQQKDTIDVPKADINISSPPNEQECIIAPSVMSFEESACTTPMNSNDDTSTHSTFIALES